MAQLKKYLKIRDHAASHAEARASGSVGIPTLVVDDESYVIESPEAAEKLIFSFVDKMISSFSSLIQGIALAAAGVGSIIITPNEPVAGSFNTSIMICFCIVPIIGHVATVIAMHFYKLDHKKMEEVQQQLAERKAMNVKEA